MTIDPSKELELVKKFLDEMPRTPCPNIPDEPYLCTVCERLNHRTYKNCTIKPARVDTAEYATRPYTLDRLHSSGYSEYVDSGIGAYGSRGTHAEAGDVGQRIDNLGCRPTAGAMAVGAGDDTEPLQREKAGGALRFVEVFHGIDDDSAMTHVEARKKKTIAEQERGSDIEIVQKSKDTGAKLVEFIQIGYEDAEPEKTPEPVKNTLPIKTEKPEESAAEKKPEEQQDAGKEKADDAGKIQDVKERAEKTKENVDTLNAELNTIISDLQKKTGESLQKKTPVTYPEVYYDVYELEGVKKDHIDALRKEDVLLSNDLLYADLEALGKTTGIDGAVLASMRAQAELATVKSIGIKYAHILANAGINGIVDLTQQTPDAAMEKVAAYLKKTPGIDGGNISKNKMTRFIDDSKKVQKTIGL